MDLRGMHREIHRTYDILYVSIMGLTWPLNMHASFSDIFVWFKEWQLTLSFMVLDTLRHWRLFRASGPPIYLLSAAEFQIKNENRAYRRFTLMIAITRRLELCKISQLYRPASQETGQGQECTASVLQSTRPLSQYQRSVWCLPEIYSLCDSA